MYYVLELKTGVYHTIVSDSPIKALAAVIYPYFFRDDPNFAEWLIEQSVIVGTDVLTYDGFSVQY